MIGFLDLIITEKCDSRCRICSIWREGKKTGHELSKEDINHILDSEAAKSVSCIDISGGEPFLRDDLVEITNLIKKRLPEVKLSISTNGINTHKILGDMEKIRAICDIDLRISLDGLKETHNIQRGLDDAFDRTMNTVKEIKRKYPDQHITFIFVATPWNYKDLVNVYKLVKSINPNYTLLATVAQDVSNYKTYLKNKSDMDYREKFTFSDKEKVAMKEQFEMLCKEYLKEKDFVNAFFVSQIPSYIDNNKVLFCDVPENTMVVLPSGLVYNCIMMDSIGKLNKAGLDSILNSKEAEDARLACRDRQCPGCMLFMGSHITYNKIYKLFEFFYNKREIIDKNIIVRLDLDEPVDTLVSKVNGDKAFISFVIKSPNLMQGEKIKKIVAELKKKVKGVVITRPIPRCVMGMEDTSLRKELGIPRSCADCYELFVNGKGIELCKFLEERVPLSLMEEPDLFFRKANSISSKNSKCVSCNPLQKIKCKSPCFDYSEKTI